MRYSTALGLAVLVATCLASEPEVDPAADVEPADDEEIEDGAANAQDLEQDPDEPDGDFDYPEEEEDKWFQDNEDGEPIPFDNLNKKQRDKCGKLKYVKKHFARCCGTGNFKYRPELCAKASPKEDPDLRTTAYPKLRSAVSDRCTACVRMVDNFDLGMLPRLREQQKLIQKHYKTKYAKSATFGGFDSIIEEEVSKICQWPRTFHNMKIRKACSGLVDDREDEIIASISEWARMKLSSDKWMRKHDKLDRAATRLWKDALPGPDISEYDAKKEKFAEIRSKESAEVAAAARKSIPMKKKDVKQVKRMARNALPPTEQQLMIAAAGEEQDSGEVFDMHKALASNVGMARDDELISQFRPALCVKALEECTDYDMYELETQDADERAKLSHAALTGRVMEQPAESDLPSVDNQTCPITFVVASDFVRRAVLWGKNTDFLIYMYYPGRWNVTDDTHAKMRPKWIKLAQLLDPYASNGAFAVAWIDLVFNQLPFPHGSHITQDAVGLYSAGEANKDNPKYMADLRDGDIHIKEIIDFLYEASTNIATKLHIERRLSRISPDQILHGLKYMTFVQSLVVDERTLKPDNLTELREEYEVQRALPAPGAKDPRAKRKALPNPQDELMEAHGYDKHGNDLLERRNKLELRRLRRLQELERGSREWRERRRWLHRGHRRQP